MQSSHFVNPFGGCQICSQNVDNLATQMFYKDPLMINGLLRTSPKQVIKTRNGHIIAVVLLIMHYWMQICYKY